MNTVPAIEAVVAFACVLGIGVRAFWRVDREWALRHIARRCEIHDRAPALTIRRLEAELGMEPSKLTGSFASDHANPGIIDCGHAWCRRRH